MRHTVGEAARAAGVSVRTLHHYDDIGLVRPAARTPAGYLLYDEDDLERLFARETERLGRMLAPWREPWRRKTWVRD